MVGLGSNGVLKMMEGVADVVRHGQINSPVGVVPVQGYATVFGGVPIDREFVEGGEGVNEVLGVGLSNV